MTIEVREILVKASVTNHPGERESQEDEARRLEALKAELLEECRRLVTQLLREERER